MQRRTDEHYESAAEATVNQAIDLIEELANEERPLTLNERRLLREAARIYQAHTGLRLDLSGIFS